MFKGDVSWVQNMMDKLSTCFFSSFLLLTLLSKIFKAFLDNPVLTLFVHTKGKSARHSLFSFASILLDTVK